MSVEETHKIPVPLDLQKFFSVVKNWKQVRPLLKNETQARIIVHTVAELHTCEGKIPIPYWCDSCKAKAIGVIRILEKIGIEIQLVDKRISMENTTLTDNVELHKCTIDTDDTVSGGNITSTGNVELHKCPICRQECTIHSPDDPSILLCPCKRHGYYKGIRGIEGWYDYNPNGGDYEEWFDYDKNGKKVHFRNSAGIEHWRDENGKWVDIKPKNWKYEK